MIEMTDDKNDRLFTNGLNKNWKSHDKFMRRIRFRSRYLKSFLGGSNYANKPYGSNCREKKWSTKVIAFIIFEIDKYASLLVLKFRNSHYAIQCVCKIF